MYCRKCGKQLAESFQCCPYCSTPVNPPAPQTVPRAADQKPGKKKKTWIWAIACVVLVVVGVLLCVCLLPEAEDRDRDRDLDSEDENLQYYTIQTDSMYPTFRPGDRIACEEVEDPSALRTGDIITYWSVINGERVLNTHRIVAIYDGGGYLIFETKGDANSKSDSLTVHESELVGKYVKTVRRGK